MRNTRRTHPISANGVQLIGCNHILIADSKRVRINASPTDIVDQRCDAPQFFDRHRNSRIDIGLLSDITGNTAALLASLFFDCLSGFFCKITFEISNQHLGTSSAKYFSYSGSNVLRAACDNNFMIGETKIFKCVHGHCCSP